ncbi:unnamed protein product [Haemonchus placei]|uniref:Reverse transcriptase domain-containing protein n=1 Tax=Haemonchus placei TaxID=6290 RepID=A0A0N4WK61_HAEPC|nr:unnamed protein product [Haemonchus placei]
MAVKQSLREYGRTKLLKAAEARSSIRRCKRDLSDQKAVMSALLDKDGSLDNITVDLLRSRSTALHTLLAEHFNHYLKLKRFPEQRKEPKTILLFQERSARGIHNYRPISLLSVVYKSFTIVLLHRMESILDEHHSVEQSGFRRNFSCMHNIQAVGQLIERSREYRLPSALLFVDYKKASDSVAINAVLNVLMQAGVDPDYVHLFEQCLSNTSTFIQLFDPKLKIPVGKGVRQGDTIFPKFFTAAL